MKTANAKELNEQYRDCPTQEQVYMIEGRKYIVVSHYTGKKDLDEVVYRNAYNQAIAELDTLTQSVYENMVLGKVPEEVCVKLIDKYREENKTLQTELDTVTARLDTINQDECDVDEFIRRLKKYAGFEVLTREMILDLVEYITVEDVPENRNTPRKIHIYYKFLDKALPDKRNALM